MVSPVALCCWKELGGFWSSWNNCEPWKYHANSLHLSLHILQMRHLSLFSLGLYNDKVIGLVKSELSINAEGPLFLPSSFLRSRSSSWFCLSICGRKNHGPSMICEYITWYGKRDLANMTMLSIATSKIILDYPGTPIVIALRVLMNGRRNSHREIWRCYAVGLEDEGRDHKPRNAGGL